MGATPDGTYDVFFTSGTDWNGGQFSRACTFQRFDKMTTFTTTTTASGIEYTTYRITLQSMINGNAQVITVPSDSFPKQGREMLYPQLSSRARLAACTNPWTCRYSKSPCNQANNSKN
jgi:hypothetical protein